MTSFFEAENPLEERLGKAFFEKLPTAPGIYKMFGRGDHLLYIGKAKNLRSRLFTYRRASGANCSRKVWKLVRMVQHITLEQLSSEEEALLRENELIRRHRPPFNHAKKAPETYYYISAVPEREEIVFDLNMDLREKARGHTYGAFKGHRRVRRALGALLRQLYIMERLVGTPFDLPVQLTRSLTPVHYRLEVARPRHPLLHDYFYGSSDRLLYRIIEDHLDNSRLEKFIGKLILKDMEALRWFYDRAARRNFKIREMLGLGNSLIPQEKLDDYLVMLAFED
ncbi:nucleotide excision repair endonuclease [Fodinibius sediminis]|uniref:Excinuclease cho n=1 Tax=Fodinibius sediminis TaxID=1214077 RepID=A0A521E4M5_9BACT|nr:nucleotide excision repair endonuclease [Fodinibius sediminis]SMO78802.1 GIY-YIG catalytic domain-containing protein [Fodinibius sediminis]